MHCDCYNFIINQNLNLVHYLFICYDSSWIWVIMALHSFLCKLFHNLLCLRFSVFISWHINLHMLFNVKAM